MGFVWAHVLLLPSSRSSRIRGRGLGLAFGVSTHFISRTLLSFVLLVVVVVFLSGSFEPVPDVFMLLLFFFLEVLSQFRMFCCCCCFSGSFEPVPGVRLCSDLG